MTHTLHRRGDPEELARDFVFTAMASKGINTEGTAERMKRFYEIVMRHKPVFLGDAARGNQLTLGLKTLVDGCSDGTIAHAVFRDADTVAAVIKELIDAGFDRSVVVSGLFDRVKECCRRAGIGVPHTIEYSLGTWGRTEKLPPSEYLPVMTMCGHAQVPAALVRHVVEQVRAGRLTPDEAGLKLGHQCTCGVFNVARASELVAALAAKG